MRERLECEAIAPGRQGAGRRAFVDVTPELLVSLLKKGTRTTRVTAHALPDDARVVGAESIPDHGSIRLVLESASFQYSDGGDGPRLPTPRVESVRALDMQPAVSGAVVEVSA